MYRVVLTRRAERSLAKSPSHIQEKMATAIDTLQYSFAPSRILDVKKLRGLENAYRIRIGDWRIVYEVQKSERLILVHDILPRKRAYN